ncbi:hypothetical protein LCGC14_0513790 [marine sediment metagenome]|uniref:Uncharacterized protein n=1 Tax=marine sediment metagenome TaxID=412755 RepID=A0A0F9SIV9_9ZZZZ
MTDMICSKIEGCPRSGFCEGKTPHPRQVTCSEECNWQPERHATCEPYSDLTYPLRPPRGPKSYVCNEAGECGIAECTAAEAHTHNEPPLHGPRECGFTHQVVQCEEVPELVRCDTADDCGAQCWWHRQEHKPTYGCEERHYCASARSMTQCNPVPGAGVWCGTAEDCRAPCGPALLHGGCGPVPEPARPVLPPLVKCDGADQCKAPCFGHGKEAHVHFELCETPCSIILGGVNGAKCRPVAEPLQGVWVSGKALEVLTQYQDWSNDKWDAFWAMVTGETARHTDAKRVMAEANGPGVPEAMTEEMWRHNVATIIYEELHSPKRRGSSKAECNSLAAARIVELPRPLTP